jgi:hypothetical protein
MPIQLSAPSTDLVSYYLAAHHSNIRRKNAENIAFIYPIIDSSLWRLNFAVCNQLLTFNVTIVTRYHDRQFREYGYRKDLEWHSGQKVAK